MKLFSRFLLAVTIFLLSIPRTGLGETVAPAPELAEMPLEGEKLQKEVVYVKFMGDEAEHWANFNRNWDIGFKILLMFLSIFVAVIGGMIAAKPKESVPAWMPVVTSASTAVIAAITTFAFTQINFSSRAAVWFKKAQVYRNISYALDFGTPPQGELHEAVRIVDGWGDATSSDAAIPQYRFYPSDKKKT